jgi:hypothetical protein
MARVKAETEAALFEIGFRDAYALHPGFIQPKRGAASRMRSVRWMYALTAPIYPFLQKRFSRFVTSTDRSPRKSETASSNRTVHRQVSIRG